MRVIACSLAAVLLLAPAARAEISGGKVKIGVLTDLSGPYEQNSGTGSVEAAKMAAEEFGNKVNGMPIEIVAADHQNKPDVGAAIARKWFDLEGVDAITDLVNSAVAFAALDVAKSKNKAVLLTSAGSADFTGKACAPDNSVHWVYDTYQMGNAIGQAVPQLGKKWFFIGADYVFGRALVDGASGGITRHGGQVLGAVYHPLGASDFSSFVLQAQASKADVIGIANGGDDAINAVKSVREFGIIAARAGLAAGDPQHRARSGARHDVRDAVDPRPQCREQGVHGKIHRAQEDRTLDLPGRDVFGGAQLSQGGRGDELRRPQDRDRENARDAGRRRLRSRRKAAARRPHGPRRLSRADQVAGRIPR
jgi:substrate-binding family protein